MTTAHATRPIPAAPVPGTDGGSCFVLRADLLGAVNAAHPIHLDGVLLRMRELRDGEEAIGTPFPALSRRDGVFQCSAGFLAAPALVPVTFTTHGAVKGLRFTGDADDRSIRVGNGRRIVGPMDTRLRTRLSRHPTIENATSIYWQCRGDPDAALLLARRVLQVGGRRGGGYGEVSRWSVLPCRPDVDPRTAGLLAHGRVLRTLPASMVDGIPEGARPALGRLEPPYGDPRDHVPVVVPTLRSLSGGHADARALFGF